MNVEDLPGEVIASPDNDDLDCGPSEEDLEDCELRRALIDRVASRIDPDAFDRAVPRLDERRDAARRKAADALILFEAARLGLAA